MDKKQTDRYIIDKQQAREEELIAPSEGGGADCSSRAGDRVGCGPADPLGVPRPDDGQGADPLSLPLLAEYRCGA